MKPASLDALTVPFNYKLRLLMLSDATGVPANIILAECLETGIRSMEMMMKGIHVRESNTTKRFGEVDE